MLLTIIQQYSDPPGKWSQRPRKSSQTIPEAIFRPHTPAACAVTLIDFSAQTKS